ncbi:MAG: hypothetical protein ACXWCP_02780, partial [Burkholderiales bacterium]
MGAHIHFDRPGSPRLHDMPVTVPRLPRAKLSKAGEFRLPIQTLPQPDETTCGPTCLHAVYSYWGEHEPLDQVIARNYRMQHGGTFAVFLACD